MTLCCGQDLHFWPSSSTMGSMNIILNGTSQQLDSANLEDIVRRVCKNPAHVIAELNGDIIAGTERPKVTLKDGDRLELVSFVGGG